MLLAAITVLRVLPWMSGILAGRWHHLEAESALLARTEAELEGATRLEDSATAVKGALDQLPPKLLAGKSEADAAADLAGRIGRESAARQVRLEQTDVVADTVRTGWLRRVTVSAQLEGDMNGIGGLMASLAAGSPVVVLDRIRVVAGDQAGDRRPERLRVEIVARGWYLVEERGS